MSVDVSAGGLLELHAAGVPRPIIVVILDRVARDGRIADTLDNTSIGAMIRGKLPKDILLAKMRQTPAVYNVTAEGLVALHQEKVPKDVITMMMHTPFGAEPAKLAAAPGSSVITRAPASPDSANTQTLVDSPKPHALPAPPRSDSRPAPTAARTLPSRTPKLVLSPLPTESGIHFVAGAGGVELLEPTTFTSGRTSNVLASALTSGLAPVKLKAIVAGNSATIRSDDASLEFYFVFDRTSGGLSSSGSFWSALTSPNEFTLVRLDTKTDRREATVGSFSALGSQTGTEGKSVVPTTFVRLKPGVYRVTPKAPLPPGEYAFFPASAFGNVQGASRLFDFGVDGPGQTSSK